MKSVVTFAILLVASIGCADSKVSTSDVVKTEATPTAFSTAAPR